MPSTSSLSPRSYAILGLLAIRDWTTYELALQMERSTRPIWAAARSMVYDEPKRLVRLGLAQARTETAGLRTRTWYSITPAGRAALRGWLAEPGAPPAMQFEGLLKVLLADTSQPDTINASLTEAIKWADEIQDVGRRSAPGTRPATGYSRNAPSWSPWPTRSSGTTPNLSAAGPPGPSSRTSPVHSQGTTTTSSARPCAAGRSCRPVQTPVTRSLSKAERVRGGPARPGWMAWLSLVQGPC